MRWSWILTCALMIACAATTPLGAVTLVEEGQPAAVLVTADDPNPMAEYAVEELVRHIESATGATLQVRRESEAPDAGMTRVYVGETQAARLHGIDPDALGPDELLIRVIDGDVFVLGNENGDAHPLHTERSSHNQYSGTLFAAYEFIERTLQVRWLWPGELGTYIPPRETVTVDPSLDVQEEPAFRFRQFRYRHLERARDIVADPEGHGYSAPDYHYGPTLRRLAFSDEVLLNYVADLDVYVRRHRMGATDPKPEVGHHFTSWWDRYGQEHPEWFMLNEAGERGPAPGQSRQGPRNEYYVAMCVSNEDLHRYIVEEHWDGGDLLSLGEVDRRDFCRCHLCRAWDPVEPVDPPSFAEVLYDPFVSDRYARFWKTIQEKAAQRNPDVLVTSYLYWNYFPAPVTDIELNENIYGEFVPWGRHSEVIFFPLEEEPYQWKKDQWRGWAETGITMAYRPNYFHGGYVMPDISTWQAGEFLKFTYEHGSIGIDYDSLVGHWATKGLMLYVHMRLFADPEADIHDIRQEYFAAFGPAAEHVERYFDYWEDYSHERLAHATYPGRGLFHPEKQTHIAYPPEVFPPAEQILEQAHDAAATHSRAEYAERVAFLKAGLEHARLAARFMGTLDEGRVPRGDPDRFAEAQQALKALIAFRREHEHLYFADLVSAGRRESNRIDIEQLLEETDFSARLPDALGEWTFRKDPDDAGRFEQWHAADLDDDRWQVIDVPAHWQDTHVGDYLGYGWYRTTMTIPAEKADRPLELKFHGVDEQAWVYVNGRLVEEHTTESENLGIGDLWDKPFSVELDPAYIEPGENTLVVRVHASQGNGGIWSPVILHEKRD